MTSWACPAQLLSPSSSPKARWEHCAPGPVCSRTGNPGTRVNLYGPMSRDLWNPPEVWTHRWRKPSSSRIKAPWWQVRARDPMTSKEWGHWCFLATNVHVGHVTSLNSGSTWQCCSAAGQPSKGYLAVPFRAVCSVSLWILENREVEQSAYQLYTSQTFGASDPPQVSPHTPCTKDKQPPVDRRYWIISHRFTWKKCSSRQCLLRIR